MRRGRTRSTEGEKVAKWDKEKEGRREGDI